MLTKLKYNQEDLKKLVWKPIYDSEGQAFLVADSKTASGELYGAAQGPMIYYNNQYYYFKGSLPNKAYSQWVQDRPSQTSQGFTKEFMENNCILIK